MNQKVVLITEKSSHEFAVVDKKNYILEGIFAIFGRENVNHRIYEETEYLPHLEYLQEKIKRNKLAGELDHPEKFDVSLQNISHLVEKLWYDKETRTLRGRIRLLDTDPAGLNARKLVDAGFPISISSRAAGVVKENKTVQIKRIFTYDLVADGGFGNDAELDRVYESVCAGLHLVTDLPMINESLGFVSDDNIKLYDVTDKYPDLLKENADFSIYDYSFAKKSNLVKEGQENEYINKNNSSNMENTTGVTAEEMYKYSVHVKEEFEKFEKTISALTQRIEELQNSKVPADATTEVTESASDERIAVLEKEIKILKGYSGELRTYVENTMNYVDLIAEDHNWLANYTEKIAEDHNHLANYTERIAEDHNHVANYAEKVAEDHNYVASYLNDKIRPLLEKNIAYASKIAEQTNYGLNYMEDVLAKELHETQSYVNDVLSEKLNHLWNYQDYIMEKTNEVHLYADYLGENAATREDLENVAGFAETVSESIKTTAQPAVNEKENLLSKYTSLGTKIDNLLESIQTQKMNPINEQIEKYPFLSNLNGDQVKKFISFTDIQKQQYVNAVNETNAKSKDEMVALLERAETQSLAPKTNLWLEKMPVEYKETWESLTESAKNQIISQSKLYTLNTAYQINNFWQTRGLHKVEGNGVLNESAKQTVENNNVSELGYSRDYMNSVKESLNRFNK
jgi:hypothetical protein